MSYLKPMEKLGNNHYRLSARGEGFISINRKQGGT